MFLGLIVLPVAEIYLIIQFGKYAGVMNTVLALLAGVAVGVSYARQQGLAFARQARRSVYEGRMPADKMLHGVGIWVGSILLIVPGFITDLIGFSLLIPWTRLLWLKYAARVIQRKIQRGEIHVGRF
jgi:UPF0716 protein FxsA